jgi:hypothetical protein
MAANIHRLTRGLIPVLANPSKRRCYKIRVKTGAATELFGCIKLFGLH